jgi:uncharacterized membrane protein
MAIIRNSIITVTGGALYALIEILFRGKTHWSMTIAGGLCLLTMNFIRSNTRVKLPLKLMLSGLAITVIEFLFGCVVNLMLGWNVWSYSFYPANLLGQVCLRFTFLWILLAIPAFGYLKFLNKHVFPRIFSSKPQNAPRRFKRPAPET